MHPHFTALRTLLIAFAQPSASAQPGQGALHHPPTGHHLKAVAIRFPPHHGQQPTASGPSPGHHLTDVTASAQITRNLGNRPNSLANTSLAPSRSPYLIRGCPLRCVACVRLLFCPRHSRVAPFFSGLHRLAVDDGRAGCGLSACCFPNLGPQGLFYPLPCLVISPVAEVPSDRAPRWQVVRQQTPGTTGAQHVPDGIHHLPAGVLGGPATRLHRRNQGFQNLPLGLRQIRGINCSAHASSL